MSQEFGTLIEEPKKKNTVLVVAVIVVILLCLCCLAAAGFLYWQGDNILKALGLAALPTLFTM
jgi:hypothetical protein